MTEDVLKVELNVYVILFLLIVWTFFVYTIGSVFYECECKYLNLQENIAYAIHDNNTCFDSFDSQIIDMRWLENYTERTVK